MFLQNVVIIVTICVTSELRANVLTNKPYNSCDDVVVYKNHSGSTIGHVGFTAKSYRVIRLTLTLDVSDGEAVFIRNTSVANENINDEADNRVGERDYKFKVNFPYVLPNPIITGISLNGRKICSGPQTNNKIKIFNSFKLNNDLRNGDSPNIAPISRRKRHAQYGDNPFLNGAISSGPSDKYSSNPFLNGDLVSVRPPSVFSSNPWLNRIGGSSENTNVYDTTPTIPPSTTTAEPVSYPCGINKITNKPLIANGKSTSKAEWPWAVGVFRKKLGSLTFQCGGTLISAALVVTAGHCVVTREGETEPSDNLSIIIGLYDIQEWQTDDSKVKNVGEVILHPAFDMQNTLKNDIALLKFQYVLDGFSYHIIPACLWSKSLKPEAIFGRYGTIVGWGRDETGLITTPTPRLTRQKVVTLEECQDSNPNFIPLTSTRTLCAGNRNGSGPCNGDSGSGMYFYINGRNSWHLRGIVSTTVPDPEAPYACNTKDYVIYTDVARYLDWIEYYLTV